MAENDCPTKSHDDPYDEAGIMSSLEEAAAAMGMSESCKSEVKNIVFKSPGERSANTDANSAEISVDSENGLQ